MYYEILVVKNGRHYFATAERSLTDFHAFKVVLKEIIKRFPESEGYEISASEYYREGKQLNIREALLKDG